VADESEAQKQGPVGPKQGLAKGPKSKTSRDGQTWTWHFAQACESLKQDCIATAQASLLMAQVKPASTQVWTRNGHLVRSVLAIVYIAIPISFLFEKLQIIMTSVTSPVNAIKARQGCSAICCLCRAEKMLMEFARRGFYGRLT
jgi:hypothetical protein